MSGAPVAARSQTLPTKQSMRDYIPHQGAPPRPDLACRPQLAAGPSLWIPVGKRKFLVVPNKRSVILVGASERASSVWCSPRGRPD